MGRLYLAFGGGRNLSNHVADVTDFLGVTMDPLFLEMYSRNFITKKRIPTPRSNAPDVKPTQHPPIALILNHSLSAKLIQPLEPFHIIPNSYKKDY